MATLKKPMATHSSTLAWKIPWMEEPGRLQSMGSRRVGHNWATSLSLFTFLHWRRKWQPTRVLAWRIPEMVEPGGLLSMGLHRVRHDWSDLAAAAAEKTAFPSKECGRSARTFLFKQKWHITNEPALRQTVKKTSLQPPAASYSITFHHLPWNSFCNYEP